MTALVCAPANPTVELVARQAPLADVSGTVRVDGRPRKDVVVWLEGPAAPVAPETRTAVLDQRNLEFAPRVLAVQAGTRVEMPNNDRVFHNVFSFKDGKQFDLGLYPVGTTRAVNFDRPGLARIFCNIHPNMAAYVLAVDAAYFAVTNAEGRFTIRGVPVGAATYHAWRPGADARTGPIEVGGGLVLEIVWP
ncbi:MAG: carboxypeptidase regulatory-like domain-containing protein [Acidobacteriota bacterium]|nr:carboxypeptidase regulatory-like domain-containing protein [Acidobacteriota bacterium]